MKKGIFKAKTNIANQKKLYIFLIGLALLSLISGIIFIFLIKEENLTEISKKITIYFTEINNANKLNILINSIINNFIYIITIWILGISLIGLPIILIIFIFKNFITGLSISSIIYTYKINGIIKTIIHIFPHQIILLIILLLIFFYSISFCIKLFKYLFLKKIINFKEVMQKYLKILIISLLVTLFTSIYEAYISTYLLNYFN